ncbi:hypothetical protein DSO57_1002125 [Entomophthora muscae]|uniref:Uncharacterized protein n=1 Tax=Entomophthora muscae TaxID=34485 RepID=A0ACC2TW82_9FUNG|nr:hypothetical protein DSO57_1002125 [Entomophthora muscae]
MVCFTAWAIIFSVSLRGLDPRIMQVGGPVVHRPGGPGDLGSGFDSCSWAWGTRGEELSILTPTANPPSTNTGVLKPTLETLKSNPDPPNTTQVTQSGQETTHLLNCKTKLMSYSETHQSPKDNSPNGHQIDANLEPPKIWTYAEVVACLKEVKKNLLLTLPMTSSNCQPFVQNG